MLSAQQREFEEKKKDSSPYPRDFSRWYALDSFLRPSRFKSQRFYVTLSAAIGAMLLSFASVSPRLHHVHQAAPVSLAHASYNNDCAACHDQAFQPIARLFGSSMAHSVSDANCNKCHEGMVHHATQAHQPACVACHREHRGHEVLATHVADRQCVGCHRDLPNHLQSGAITTFHPTITQFNRDHPEFRATTKDMKDPSKIKFNHKAHLDLDIDALRIASEKAGRDLKLLPGAMTCAHCHQMDDERKYLLPISYDKHCMTCHTLNVGLTGEFANDLKAAASSFARTPLPHKEPAIVRAVLRDRLVQFAQQHAIVGSKVELKLPRPLPWKPERNVTDEQWSWASAQAAKAEALLFLNKQAQKADVLTSCGQCHIEKGRADGVPIYEKSAIPSRWYPQSVFNHGSHRNMTCIDCHDQNAHGQSVAQSRTASDVLMPTLQKCQECHVGKGGSRNACVECHRYHSR